MSSNGTNGQIGEQNRVGAMASKRERLLTYLRKFHEGEEGLTTVETLLLIFVAIVILLAVVKFIFPSVWDQVKAKIQELIGGSYS